LLPNLCFAGATTPIQDSVHRIEASRIVMIADGTVDIPGKDVKFSNLGEPVASGSNVAFVITDPITWYPKGIYLFNGKKIVTVADEDTLVPGSKEKFTDLGFPVISGSNVAFTGKSASVEGIYLFNGRKIVTVADTKTNIPGAGGKFSNLDYPAVSGGNVAFCVVDRATGYAVGVYLSDGRKIKKITDTSTFVPGTTDPFTNMFSPSIDGSNVLLFGGTTTRFGFYVFNGKKLFTAVDSNTTIPGTRTKFLGFAFYGQDPMAGSFAFTGYGESSTGVYLYSIERRKLVKAADTNTTIPGSNSRFTAFDAPKASGDYVVFSAVDASYEPTGIYFFDGKNLRIVADTNTYIPGTLDKFSILGLTRISGDRVAFITRDADYNATGIYLYRASSPGAGLTLFSAADLNTVIPGTQEKFSVLGYPSISDSRVAFVGGATGIDGVYVYMPAELKTSADYQDGAIPMESGVMP
jgi:hypothetical protein